MAKTTAWLMTLVGVLWVLPLININLPSNVSNWLIGLSFLVIGITKLVRNYKLMKK